MIMEALIFIIVAVFVGFVYHNHKRAKERNKTKNVPDVGVFKDEEKNNQSQYAPQSVQVESAKNDTKEEPLHELSVSKNTADSIDDLFVEYTSRDLPKGLKRSDGSALKDMISRLYPSENGLYPHEILLLHYARTFTYNQKKYQQFWYYRYLIPNVQSVLHSLVDRGFLTLECLQDRLNSHTLKELKPLLEKKGLKACKKKSDAINLIIDNYEFHELPQKLVGDNSAHYVLTDLGLSELQNNQYVLFAHKNSSISLEKLNHVVINQKRDYMQAVRESLKEKAEDSIKNKWRHNRYWVKRYAEVCADSGDFIEGIRYLCASIALDLNIANGHLEYSSQKAYDLMTAIRNYFPYERNSLGAMSDSLIALTKSYLIGSGLDESKFKQAILSHFVELKVDGDIFSPEQLADIVMLEVHEETAALEKLYSNIQIELQKKLDDMPEEQAYIRSMFLDKYED